MTELIGHGPANGAAARLNAKRHYVEKVFSAAHGKWCSPLSLTEFGVELAFSRATMDLSTEEGAGQQYLQMEADGRLSLKYFDGPTLKKDMENAVRLKCRSEIERIGHVPMNSQQRYNAQYAVLYKYRVENDITFLALLPPPQVQQDQRPPPAYQPPVAVYSDSTPLLAAQAQPQALVAGFAGPRCYKCQLMAVNRCEYTECCEECPKMMCLIHSHNRRRGRYRLTVCDEHQANCTLM